MIYVEVAEVFDRFDHFIICHKLPKFDVTGKLRELSGVFLKSKHEAVVANGADFVEPPILSRVPHGFSNVTTRAPPLHMYI